MAALLCFMKIILPSVLFLNLCLQIRDISAQPFGQFCDNTVGNYSQSSNFEANLNTILSSIVSDINKYGFYNNTVGDGVDLNTVGDGVDQVNAIGLCRGDIDIEFCRDCVHDAAYYLTGQCPNQKEAIQWYDECMFRYSNKSILGIKTTTGGYHVTNTQNASNVNFFSRDLRSFAGKLVEQTYNGSFLKFAESKMIDANNQTVYGYMQCTPDITSTDCMSCLDYISNNLSDCCYNQVGARFISPSCIFRYETYPFLNTLSNQSPPSTTTNPKGISTTEKNKKRSKSNTIKIIFCVIALLFITLNVGAFIAGRRWQKKNTEQKHKDEEEKEELKSIGDSETRQLNFALIKDATDDFSTANLLGRGGFGEVYKGVLSNGEEIAVKRLSKTSVQGEKEFRNEVTLLAKLQHKCLVKLLGFCLEKTERLLVYEFMVNGSLDKFLFNARNRSRLDWRERYQIINSVAKGLLYLHEDSRLMIIHRDLKASNILLDQEMNAKISDFGTAKLFGWDESQVNTKRITGTKGYMAPEYVMHGLISVKSDVYSYGVLLLEIITGKKNYSSLNIDKVEDLLSYVYISWKEGRVFDLIDPILTAQSYPIEIIMRCIHIALLCVQENIGTRPTMATVVLMLQSLTITLPLPQEPDFFNNTNSLLSEIQESSRSSNQSNTKSNRAIAHYDPSLKDSDLYPN